MNFMQTISVPSLVRLKPGALARVGVYLGRADHRRVALMVSAGLNAEFSEPLEQGAAEQGIAVLRRAEIGDATFEQATQQFSELPSDVQAIVGIGGGKALDAAKYLAFLADLAYYAVPTSRSNDGFCSPQSSLTVAGKRRSLPARLPAGVVIDTDVCLRARSLMVVGPRVGRHPRQRSPTEDSPYADRYRRKVPTYSLGRSSAAGNGRRAHD